MKSHMPNNEPMKKFEKSRLIIAWGHSRERAAAMVPNPLTLKETISHGPPIRFRNTFVTLMSQLSATPSVAIARSSNGPTLAISCNSTAACAGAPALQDGTLECSTELYPHQSGARTSQCLITRNTHQDQYITAALYSIHTKCLTVR